MKPAKPVKRTNKDLPPKKSGKVKGGRSANDRIAFNDNLTLVRV